MPVQLTSEFFDMTDATSEPRIVFIEGEKINLVLIEKRDVRTLLGYMNDSEVTRYLLRHMPLYLEEEEEWVQSMAKQKDNLCLGIVEKGKQTLLGTVSLGRIDRRDGTAILGLSIGDKKLWGKGYGSEATELMLRFAFDHMDLRGVELSVFACNHGAIKVYKKCGFIEVGRIPKWLFLSHRMYADKIIMICMRPK